MQKVVFIGSEKVVSKFEGKEYTTYHMYCGSSIEDKNGLGLKPMDFKLSLDEYKEIIENCSEGTEFEISYDTGYDKNGKFKRFLKSMNF